MISLTEINRIVNNKKEKQKRKQNTSYFRYGECQSIRQIFLRRLRNRIAINCRRRETLLSPENRNIIRIIR